MRGRLESARDGICDADRCARRRGCAEIEISGSSSTTRNGGPEALMSLILFSFADPIETTFILARCVGSRPFVSVRAQSCARLKLLLAGGEDASYLRTGLTTVNQTGGRLAAKGSRYLFKDLRSRGGF